MARKEGDRIRLLDSASSSSLRESPDGGSGPGVNRLGDLLGGATLPPPEVQLNLDKAQVRMFLFQCRMLLYLLLLVSIRYFLLHFLMLAHQSPSAVSMNEFMEDINTIKGDGCRIILLCS
jgi:hypothetical protein